MNFFLLQHDMLIYIKFFKNIYIYPLALTNLSHNIHCWYQMNGRAIVYNTPCFE